MQGNFKIPQSLTELNTADDLTQERNQCKEHTLLDKINSFIIKDDEHYKRFKFDRHSNFKRNVVNTLGIFENEKVYQKLMMQLCQVSKMYTTESLMEDEEVK